MNLEAERIDLAKRVLETNDANPRLQIRFLFEDQDELNWNKRPREVQDGITFTGRYRIWRVKNPGK